MAGGQLVLEGFLALIAMFFGAVCSNSLLIPFSSWISRLRQLGRGLLAVSASCNDFCLNICNDVSCHHAIGSSSLSPVLFSSLSSGLTGSGGGFEVVAANNI